MLTGVVFRRQLLLCVLDEFGGLQAMVHTGEERVEDVSLRSTGERTSERRSEIRSWWRGRREMKGEQKIGGIKLEGRTRKTRQRQKPDKVGAKQQQNEGSTRK